MKSIVREIGRLMRIYLEKVILILYSFCIIFVNIRLGGVLISVVMFLIEVL